MSIGSPPFAHVLRSATAAFARFLSKSSTYWVMATLGTLSMSSSLVGDTVWIPMWEGGHSSESAYWFSMSLILGLVVCS